MQSINNSTDISRALTIQLIFAEHGDVAGDLDRRWGWVWVQDLFQPLHIRCVPCMVHNITFIIHINQLVFVISINHLSRFGLAVIAALRVCKMDNEITWPWWTVIIVIIIFIIFIRIILITLTCPWLLVITFFKIFCFSATIPLRW